MIQFKHIESSTEIARIGDYSGTSIGCVIRGAQNPIRKLKSLGNGDVLLIAKIQEIGSFCGAREKLRDEVVRECMAIVKNKYSMLGLHELNEAFRMASNMEFRGVKIELYGGVFSVPIFGRVLGAYRDYRRGLLSAVVKSNANMAKVARAERLKAKEANLELHENFHAMVLATGSKYKSWREVPAFWYGVAKQLGLITFEEGEAMRIYQWSVGTAKSELQRQVMGADTIIQRTSYQKLLDAFEQGNMSHAKVISRKVSVWVKLLGGDFNQVVKGK